MKSRPVSIRLPTTTYLKLRKQLEKSNYNGISDFFRDAAREFLKDVADDD